MNINTNHSILLLTFVVTTLSLQKSAMAFASYRPDDMIQVKRSVNLRVPTTNRQIHAVSINGRTWDMDPFMNWEDMANVLDPLFAELFPTAQHAQVLNDLRLWMGSSWVQYREGIVIARHLYKLVTELSILVERGALSKVKKETYYNKMPNSGTTGACPAAEDLCERNGSRAEIIIYCRQCMIACGRESASSTKQVDFMSNGYGMVRCARRAAWRI